MKEEFIIQILKSFLYDEYNIDIPHDVDWKWLQCYSIQNNIAGIVANFFTKRPSEKQLPKAVMEVFHETYLQCIALEVMQEIAVENIQKKLEEAGIDHISFKGVVLKEEYTIPELRSMGDLDIIIRLEDRKQAHKILLDLEYCCTGKTGAVWVYENEDVTLEVHTKLMETDLLNGVDYESYFGKPFEHAICIEGEHSYRFDNEYHFIYLVAHAAKHFMVSGYGIRGNLDFAFFLKNHCKELDWNYIWAELKALRLDIYAKCLLTLCRDWFDVEIPPEVGETDETVLEELKDKILAGGIYGKRSRKPENPFVKNQLNKKRTGNMVFDKVIAIVLWIFPNYRYMRRYLNCLEGRPYLLPVAWVVRWFEAVFCRGKLSWRRLRAINTVDSVIREDKALKEKLGLM